MRISEKNGPIGVFDSGIGGLTVANAVKRLLPNEKLIYFGDTAHLPYGDKSATAIRGYSLRIARFLLERECKMVVIACNTASSVAYTAVKKQCGASVPVVNVIDPMVQYVTGKYGDAKVGVIGTKGTISSRVYVRKIRKISPESQVTSLATPLLAPMIEEGYFNNHISKTIIHSYLEKSNLQDIKALILGCTHYPLIKKELESFYKKKTEVIDSSEIVAQFVQQRLMKKGLLSDRKKAGSSQFFVSDYTKAFEESTRLFFPGEVQLKKAAIWD